MNDDFVRSWYYRPQGSVPTGTLTTARLSAPKWYHLATSFDTTGGKLYVDGQLIASGAWNGFPGVSTSQQGLILGEMLAADGSHQNYRGLIDDVRIYNRTLTGAEISSLYQIEANPFRRAQATAEVINGFVVGVNIADGGQGYSEPPSVEIIGSGNGAKAVATMAFGRVVGVQVTNAGTGYSGAVSVRIAPPPKAPTLSLAVQTVRLTLGVVEGKRYLLESSKDLLEWVSQGEFTASADTETRDFNAAESGQYFRIWELP